MPGLEVKNNLGLTPLTCAVYRGDAETIAIFAEKGANVDVRNNDGYIPLQELARSGLHPESIPLLIRYGLRLMEEIAKGIHHSILLR